MHHFKISNTQNHTHTCVCFNYFFMGGGISSLTFKIAMHKIPLHQFEIILHSPAKKIMQVICEVKATERQFCLPILK